MTMKQGDYASELTVMMLKDGKPHRYTMHGAIVKEVSDCGRFVKLSGSIGGRRCCEICWYSVNVLKEVNPDFDELWESPERKDEPPARTFECGVHDVNEADILRGGNAAA